MVPHTPLALALPGPGEQGQGLDPTVLTVQLDVLPDAIRSLGREPLLPHHLAPHFFPRHLQGEKRTSVTAAGLGSLLGKVSGVLPDTDEQTDLPSTDLHVAKPNDVSVCKRWMREAADEMLSEQSHSHSSTPRTSAQPVSQPCSLQSCPKTRSPRTNTLGLIYGQNQTPVL